MEQGRSGRPVLVLVAQLPKWYFCLSSAPVVRFWCCEHRFRKDWKAQQNPKSQFSIYAHIVFINFFFSLRWFLIMKNGAKALKFLRLSAIYFFQISAFHSMGVRF